MVARAPGDGIRCLTVISGARRYDVVVDEHLLVEDVLSLVLPGSDLLAMTMAGQPLRLDRSVVDSGLETGSMILTTSARIAVTPPGVRSAVEPSGVGGGDAKRANTAVSNAGSRSVLVASSASGVDPTSGSSRTRIGTQSASAGVHTPRGRSGQAPSRPTPADSVRASRNGLLLTTMLLSSLAVLAFSRTRTEGIPVRSGRWPAPRRHRTVHLADPRGRPVGPARFPGPRSGRRCGRPGRLHQRAARARPRGVRRRRPCRAGWPGKPRS